VKWCTVCFVLKAADLTRPIEKKTYRGPSPTCHDFNQFTAKSDRLMLIVGFTLGQIQLVEPMLKEYNKLFNEEVLLSLVIVLLQTSSYHLSGFRKTCSLKPNPLFFRFYWGLGFVGFFRFFLFERAVGKLVG